jgi:hypothetical protein
MSKKKRFVDSPSRTGDFSEYYAVTWLWDSGYEVFINAGCTGPIDLIAYKDGDLVLIDVKTESIDTRDRGKGKYWYVAGGRTAHQKEIGVKLLGFNPETRHLRFVKHND